MSDEMRDCLEAAWTTFKKRRLNGRSYDIFCAGFRAAWNTRPSAGPDEGLPDEIEKLCAKIAEAKTIDATEHMSASLGHVVNVNSATILRALRRPQPSAWRPIETAPKDGKYYWLILQDIYDRSQQHPSIGWWDDGKWHGHGINSHWQPVLYQPIDLPAPPEGE